MKVLVCGGREYNDFDRVRDVLDSMRITSIIEGGARGADSLARAYRQMRGIPGKTYRANWTAHGRAAGPMRNAEMLADGKPDIVVAFPGGKGTADMIRRAKAAGVKVKEVV